MSINDFLNKIKGQIRIDRFTLVCLCVIVLVGVSSFELGRFSSLSENRSEVKLENNNVLAVKNNEKGNSDLVSDAASSLPLAKEKVYVASKNGKLYYKTDCSGAKRILAKNEVWFSSRENAESAGYTLSTSCK